MDRVTVSAGSRSHNHSGSLLCSPCMTSSGDMRYTTMLHKSCADSVSDVSVLPSQVIDSPAVTC